MKTPFIIPCAALLVGGLINAGPWVGSASAELLVYEPFDYPDGPLNGQGGALGTTGTWTTFDNGFAQGWWVHPEGELTGQATSNSPLPNGTLNTFDGTVANLNTSGGFAGSAGPEEQGSAFGTRDPTGNMDAHIGLAPSVTETFTTGSTTWFSFVGVRADDRNEGTPTLMLCTDPTTAGQRGLSMTNAGNGLGGGGGLPRFNLLEVFPSYYRDGVKNHSPGGWDYPDQIFIDNGQPIVCRPPRNVGIQGNGTYGLSDGILDCDGDGNDTTARDQLYRFDGNAEGTPPFRPKTLRFAEIRDNGTPEDTSDDTAGQPGIIVGKIEWDGDTGGEDVLSVVQFLETDEISEDAFDAMIAAKPALSSRNWESNKPDLDQSEFDLISIASLKFWVDEIRVATDFSDALGGGVPNAPPFAITAIDYSPGDNMVTLTWRSKPSETYGIYFSIDMIDWSGDINDLVPADPGDTTSATFDLADSGLENLTDLYFRVEKN